MSSRLRLQLKGKPISAFVRAPKPQGSILLLFNLLELTIL
jgi:hypothetical protein